MALAPNIEAVSDESAAILKRLRIDRGMTQHELADAAGVSEATIRRAEAGAHPRPSAQLKVAAVFGLRPSQIWPVR